MNVRGTKSEVLGQISTNEDTKKQRLDYVNEYAIHSRTNHVNTENFNVNIMNNMSSNINHTDMNNTISSYMNPEYGSEKKMFAPTNVSNKNNPIQPTKVRTYRDNTSTIPRTQSHSINGSPMTPVKTSNHFQKSRQGTSNLLNSIPDDKMSYSSYYTNTRKNPGNLSLPESNDSFRTQPNSQIVEQSIELLKHFLNKDKEEEIDENEKNQLLLQFINKVKRFDEKSDIFQEEYKDSLNEYKKKLDVMNLKFLKLKNENVNLCNENSILKSQMKTLKLTIHKINQQNINIRARNTESVFDMMNSGPDETAHSVIGGEGRTNRKAISNHANYHSSYIMDSSRSGTQAKFPTERILKGEHSSIHCERNFAREQEGDLMNTGSLGNANYMKQLREDVKKEIRNEVIEEVRQELEDKYKKEIENLKQQQMIQQNNMKNVQGEMLLSLSSLETNKIKQELENQVNNIINKYKEELIENVKKVCINEEDNTAKDNNVNKTIQTINDKMKDCLLVYKDIVKIQEKRKTKEDNLLKENVLIKNQLQVLQENAKAVDNMMQNLNAEINENEIMDYGEQIPDVHMIEKEFFDILNQEVVEGGVEDEHRKNPLSSFVLNDEWKSKNNINTIDDMGIGTSSHLQNSENILTDSSILHANPEISNLQSWKLEDTHDKKEGSHNEMNEQEKHNYTDVNIGSDLHNYNINNTEDALNDLGYMNHSVEYHYRENSSNMENITNNNNMHNNIQNNIQEFAQQKTPSNMCVDEWNANETIEKKTNVNEESFISMHSEKEKNMNQTVKKNRRQNYMNKRGKKKSLNDNFTSEPELWKKNDNGAYDDSHTNFYEMISGINNQNNEMKDMENSSNAIYSSELNVMHSQGNINSHEPNTFHNFSSNFYNPERNKQGNNEKATVNLVNNFSYAYHPLIKRKSITSMQESREPTQLDFCKNEIKETNPTSAFGSQDMKQNKREDSFVKHRNLTNNCRNATTSEECSFMNEITDIGKKEIEHKNQMERFRNSNSSNIMNLIPPNPMLRNAQVFMHDSVNQGSGETGSIHYLNEVERSNTYDMSIFKRENYEDSSVINNSRKINQSGKNEWYRKVSDGSIDTLRNEKEKRSIEDPHMQQVSNNMSFTDEVQMITYKIDYIQGRNNLQLDDSSNNILPSYYNKNSNLRRVNSNVMNMNKNNTTDLFPNNKVKLNTRSEVHTNLSRSQRTKAKKNLEDLFS